MQIIVITANVSKHSLIQQPFFMCKHPHLISLEQRNCSDSCTPKPAQKLPCSYRIRITFANGFRSLHHRHSFRCVSTYNFILLIQESYISSSEPLSSRRSTHISVRYFQLFFRRSFLKTMNSVMLLSTYTIQRLFNTLHTST